MRKAVLLGAALLAFLGALIWLLQATEEPLPEQFEAERPRVGPLTDEAATALSDQLRRRLEANAPAELPAARGSLEIRGKVLGADGGPVAGATVTATLTEKDESLSELECRCGNSCGRRLLECGCPESAAQLLALVIERRGEAMPMARAVSGADGSFVLGGLEAKSYALWADASAGAGLRKAATGGELAADITLSGDLPLAGKVEDEDHQPLAGAVVTAIFADHSRFFDVLSGADGKFKIGRVPPGNYTLVAVHGALLPANEAAKPDRSREVTLTLDRPRQLAGKVTRQGAPVAKATVQLEGEHRKESVQTDGQGGFSFGRLHPGDYALLAFEGHDGAQLSLTLDEAAESVELKLDPAAEVVVRVSSRGSAVRGAQVRIAIDDDDDDTDQTVRGETDARGERRFPSVPPGKVHLWVTADGYRTPDAVERTLSATQITEVEVALEPAAALSGVVVDEDGKPVVGARLGVRSDKDGDSTQTDAEGVFSFKRAPGGTLKLRVTHPEFAKLEQEVNSPATALRLVLGAGLRIRGVVLDEKDVPVMQARVRLAVAGAEDERERSAEVDEHGAFVLGGLEPGDYGLSAMVSGETGYRTGDTLKVRVPVDGPVTVRLPAAAELAGVAVDEGGIPLPDLSLMAVPDLKQARGLLLGTSYGRTTTAKDGRFRFDDLNKGGYRIQGGTAFAPVEPNRVYQTGSEVRLVLKRRPAIIGRVLGPEGPLRAFTINDEPFKSEDGTFRYAVPAYQRGARIELVFAGGAGLAMTSRSVGTPKEADVTVADVVLTRGDAVTGRVLDAETGAGVPRALVDVGPPAEPNQQWEIDVKHGAVLTGADGSFTLPHVDGRELHLYVAHADYGKTSVPLTERGNVVVKVARGGAIEVRLPGKSDLAMVRIRAKDGDDSRTLTRPEGGVYRAGGLRPGRYEVSALVYSRAAPEELGPATVQLGGTETVGIELAPRQGGATVKAHLSGGTPGTIGMLIGGDVPLPTAKDSLQALRNADRVYDSRGGGEDGLLFANIPAGRYSLMFGVFDFETQRIRLQKASVKVPESGEVTLQLTLDATATEFAMGGDE